MGSFHAVTLLVPSSPCIRSSTWPSTMEKWWEWIRCGLMGWVDMEWHGVTWYWDGDGLVEPAENRSEREVGCRNCPFILSMQKGRLPDLGSSSSPSIPSSSCIVRVSDPLLADLFFVPFLSSLSFNKFSSSGMRAELAETDRKLQVRGGRNRQEAAGARWQRKTGICR